MSRLVEAGGCGRRVSGALQPDAQDGMGDYGTCRTCRPGLLLAGLRFRPDSIQRSGTQHQATTIAQLDSLKLHFCGLQSANTPTSTEFIFATLASSILPFPVFKPGNLTERVYFLPFKTQATG